MHPYLILFLIYMLMPKVDLLAGFPLRPEDLVSLFAIAVYVVRGREHAAPRSRPILFYFAFIAVSLLSAIVHFGDLGVTGILFSFRLLQYVMWYFIVYEGCRHTDTETIRRGFIVVSAIMVFWGLLEFLDIIQPIGRFAGASERITINTSGPFETSVMLAILAYAIGSAVVAGPLLIMVLLTQARITLVGMVFSYASIKPLRALVLAACAFVAYTTVAQPILASIDNTRVAETESPTRMVRVLALSAERAPVLENPSFFREQLLDGDTIFRYMVDTDGDMSFRYRAVRWPIVIKSTLASPVEFLIGWSPGAWGNALDNYYVRTFGETGLVGLVFFCLWLATSILSAHPRGTLRFSLVMAAVVGVFIDIFTSSKVMPLIWAFLAFEHARHPFAIPRAGRVNEWLGRTVRGSGPRSPGLDAR